MSMDELKQKFIDEALKYAEVYIKKTGLNANPWELLAFTMAYHLWLESSNDEIMEIIKKYA